MIIIDNEHIDLATPTGPMRTHIVRPAAPGRYPGIVFYSEIFQITAPIRRTAAMLAGHGYIVAMPEIYHEFEPAGTVLAYDQAGSDRGNVLKTTKPLASLRLRRPRRPRPPRHPARLHRKTRRHGHLHRRPSRLPRRDEPRRPRHRLLLRHRHPQRSPGQRHGDDSLARAADIQGELLMIWGRQDPHIPTEGRMKVLARLNELGTRLSWHEVNGAHAFMRDEGIRYDPALAYTLYGLVFDLFHRKLGDGDLAAQTAGSTETRH